MDITSQLFSAAKEVHSNAYAPYSRFKVGAAIYADNLQIYAGCNVENISFPCGTCAEAGAIAAMIAGGGHKILEILIFADSQNLIVPCGACLQRISEFATPQSVIHLADTKGIQKSLHLADLLPKGFASKELQK